MRYLHLDLLNHVMRNVSRLRLRAHTLKVEAAAWLEDGSCVCDQCPGEHVQNEVHALLFLCQYHQVCELFFKDFLAGTSYLLHEADNQFVSDFLSQQNTRSTSLYFVNLVLLYVRADGFSCG